MSVRETVLNIFPSKYMRPRLRLGVLLLLAVALAACGGVAGGSWAGVSSSQSGETIYVAYDRSVVALNAASGAVLWEYPDSENRDAQFFAVPVADNGSVYVGDYKGRLHAIDAESGARQWIYEPERKTLIGPLSPDPADRVISGVALSPELAFFGLGSRNVVAVSRGDASRVWTFETGHGVWGTPLYLDAETSPRGEPVLLVTSLDHKLYALDPATGDLFWSVNLGGAAPGDMLYDADRQRVYVGTFGAGVAAVDLVEGRVVGRFQTEEWVWSSPALADDQLFIGDLGGNLYAVTIGYDGFSQNWKVNLTQEAIRGTPLVADDLVIVGARDGYIYAVNRASGAEAWKKHVEGKVLTELVSVPAEDENGPVTVVAGTDNRDNLIVALNVATGERDWTYANK